MCILSTTFNYLTIYNLYKIEKCMTDTWVDKQAI